MIQIFIPSNNLSERKYILEIIFNEFLGLTYKVEIKEDIKHYEIILENKATLIIEDYFFSKFSDDLEYLKIENIPFDIEYQLRNENPFIVEDNIPIIYGQNKYRIQNDKNKNIICGIDIFASSFFMLTRWEEYVNKKRDKHNRFPAVESLAYKNNFLDRPIINEYVEMLKNMLIELGLKQKIKIKNYELILTHDVDMTLLYRNFKSSMRKMGGDIIKRKNFILFIKTLWEYLSVKIGRKKDPYDTFDWLMDMSEKVGVKSYFFFMAKGETKFDNMYNSKDKFVEDLVKKIKSREHYIGIHPTYNAYNNIIQFKKEKKELEKNLNTKINFGREHILRFEIPTTWQIWNDNEMEWDSTVGYPEKEGFRCGVCYEYSTFNILTRKKLHLKERPLTVMEVNFLTYQEHINPNDMEIKIKKYITKVKKYNGTFVFLWHNSNFNTNQWKEYEYIYEQVIS